MLFIGCPKCYNATFFYNEALEDFNKNNQTNIHCCKCGVELKIIKENNNIVVNVIEEEINNENNDDSLCGQELGDRISEQVAI